MTNLISSTPNSHDTQDPPQDRSELLVPPVGFEGLEQPSAGSRDASRDWKGRSHDSEEKSGVAERSRMSDHSCYPLHSPGATSDLGDSTTSPGDGYTPAGSSTSEASSTYFSAAEESSRTEEPLKSCRVAKGVPKPRNADLLVSELCEAIKVKASQKLKDSKTNSGGLSKSDVFVMGTLNKENSCDEDTKHTSIKSLKKIWEGEPEHQHPRAEKRSWPPLSNIESANKPVVPVKPTPQRQHPQTVRKSSSSDHTYDSPSALKAPGRLHDLCSFMPKKCPDDLTKEFVLELSSAVIQVLGNLEQNPQLVAADLIQGSEMVMLLHSRCSIIIDDVPVTGRFQVRSILGMLEKQARELKVSSRNRQSKQILDSLKQIILELVVILKK